jgi:hypothetical protein
VDVFHKQNTNFILDAKDQHAGSRVQTFEENIRM